MAEKGSPKAKTKGVSQPRTRILLLLLVVAVLVGAFFFLYQAQEETPAPPPPRPMKAKKIQKPAVPTPAPATSVPEKPEARRPKEPQPPTEIVAARQPAPERFYEVKRGDNLWNIAGLSEIYGDHDMWKILYLANPEGMDYLYRKEGAPFVILEPGVRLRIPDPVASEKLLTAGVQEKLWVVQYSANRVLPYALSLATRLKEDGANVYVMEDLSEVEAWYLVRVGFFASKEKAHEEARKVMTSMGHTEYLVVPASAHEIHDYLPFAYRVEG